MFPVELMPFIVFIPLVFAAHASARLTFPSRFLSFPTSPLVTGNAARFSFAQQMPYFLQPAAGLFLSRRQPRLIAASPESNLDLDVIEVPQATAFETGEEVQNVDFAAARSGSSLIAPQIDVALANCYNTYRTDPTLAAAQCLRPKPTCGHRVIMYFRSDGDFPILISQASYVTHINFAFPVLHFDGSLTIGTPENLQRLLDLISIKKTTAGRHIKLSISVGGWDNSEHFSAIAANVVKLSRFIQHIADMLQRYELDGVDLDWEYPSTDGATKNTSSPQDRQNFIAMLEILREKLTAQRVQLQREQNYLLTIAATSNAETLDKGYDMPRIMQLVDWINIMTYDYYGAWPNKEGARIGPLSPLYQSAPPSLKQYDPAENIDATINAYIERTQQPDKLVLGLPFYGRFWNNVPYDSVNPQNLWRTAEFDPGSGNISGGFESYRNIRTQWMSPANQSEFEFYFDEASRTPWMYGPRSRILLTYENERSIHEKTRYAIDRKLGGVMAWAMDLDDEQYNLLRSIHAADLCMKPPLQQNTAQLDARSTAVATRFHIPALLQRQGALTKTRFVRWWTFDNDRTRVGMCGKLAPLIGGEFYAHCNPSDKAYACCDKDGLCGGGSKACDCPTCVNYYRNPALMYREPQKPTVRPLQWHTLDSPVFVNSSIGAAPPRCGPQAALINSRFAICNPDDDFGYCCSPFGFCGIGPQYCDCLGCFNYRRRVVLKQTQILTAPNNVVDPEIESPM